MNYQLNKQASALSRGCVGLRSRGSVENGTNQNTIGGV